jgi:hypothetical protein
MPYVCVHRKTFLRTAHCCVSPLSSHKIVIQWQELALCHLKGEYRTLLLDQAPMLNVRFHRCAASNRMLTLPQKLALAHRRGSAFALAVELIELGLL